ncbi:MAG: hypothetical protein KIT33_02570 [Candidatus Kapabacteria bacterium]|nr:hypothetical protein [Ignavibacteriota bacterium]MCW5883834.1 hypothetical protein [Candidatus Kapabacteria bacterium]
MPKQLLNSQYSTVQYSTVQYSTVQYKTFLLVLIMFILGNMNIYADSDPTSCDCNCNEILKPKYFYDENSIILLDDGNDCSIFSVDITGCNERTVLGFTLDFAIDPDDPCLNQNWTVRDKVTNQIIGIYNPTVTNPTFGFFDPPVQPCETRPFSFRICPENIMHCRYKSFNIGINLIFAEGDPPCPTINKTLTFAWVSSVTPDDISEYVHYNHKEENLFIDYSHLITKFQQKDLRIIISNLNGENLLNDIFNHNQSIINLSNLSNGKYFGYISRNYGTEVLATFIFSIIK